jgi:hypothetical protein
MNDGKVIRVCSKHERNEKWVENFKLADVAVDLFGRDLPPPRSRPTSF